MKLSSFVIFLFAVFHGIAQNWTPTAPIPTQGRDDGLAFSINGFGYMVTGNLNGYSESNKLFQYNPSTDSWSEKALFPGTARQYSSVFILDSKAFLIGGYSENGQALKDVWCYNPFTDSWTQKNDFPSLARWHATAISIQNEAFFGMGTTPDSTLSDFWKYDLITDSWRKLDNYPGGGQRSVLGIPIQNKGIFGEGFSINPVHYSTSWYQFDPKSEKWSACDSFPGGTRSYGTVISNGLTGIVCGGMDENGVYKNDCYSIDYSGKWNTLPVLPNPGIKGCKGFFINGNYYIGTGIDHDNNRTSNFQKLEHIDFEKDHISVFPNPSKDDFTVVTNSDAIVYVYTISGHLLQKLEVPETGFVVIEDLPIGIFVLSIEGENLFEIRKIART